MFQDLALCAQEDTSLCTETYMSPVATCITEILV
jgi:hypothetical protein